MPGVFPGGQGRKRQAGAGKAGPGGREKTGGGEQAPQGGAGITTAAESSREEESPSQALRASSPPVGASQGAEAREEREPLTVGKLLELLGSVPRDAVIRDVTAVELRSIWEPSQGQRAELYFRRKGER